MPVRKWDSGLIARTIKDYHRKGKDVSYNAMARTNQGLVSAANYYFGSYRKAVVAAGIDYRDIRRKPRWTRERVAEVIRQAHREGKDLSWARASVRKDELGHAAKAAIRERLFGNWNDALKKAGLNPLEISRYRHWSPEDIKKELRSRSKRKRPVNSKVIQIELPGLYGAAVRHFGSYDDALRKSGVDPAGVVQRRDWDRQTICKRLREFEQSFGLVSQVMLRRFDSGLLRAIRLHYRNLKAAVQVSGVRSYSIRGHRLNGVRQSLFDTVGGWREMRAQGKRPRRAALAR